MATQSLYRRYRPQRFSEMRGQEHIVRALRNAVIAGQEGQAYLFSGPRGTGKTTSARILAKVLNCELAVDGEPCCECASCIAVQNGTSFDVHELDAASNNGVDAMRDLIERTKLGTPGRHKVYILDEVHMLSKGAEAALLKTLEEPPPHVVFVLATTDPQKVSDTIRSRTQHLQFHLLPMDVLEGHIRWLASDAGLDVTDSAIESVLRRGGGSARDTISALELVAASGGDAPDEAPLDDFIEAIIDSDPGRALTAVASSIRLGRDSRTVAEALVGHLRDCFLSLMAAELVTLPDARAREVGELARRLGPAAAVRGIETIGAMLVEMRHAPDPRVLLEVALVKLASPSADAGIGALAARLDKLERMIASGAVAPGGTAPFGSSAPAGRGAQSQPPTQSPMAGTGANQGAPQVERPTRGPGGGEQRPRGDTERVTPGPAQSATRPAPDQQRAVLGARARQTADSTPPPSRSAQPSATLSPAQQSPAQQSPAPQSPAPQPPAVPAHSSTAAAPRPVTPASSDSVPSSASAPASAAAPATHAASGTTEAAWADALSTLKPVAKARYANTRLGELRDGVLTVTFASDGMRQRGEENRRDMEAALASRVGSAVRLSLAVGDVPDRPDNAFADASGPEPEFSESSAPPPPDEEVDVSDLIDAPPASHVSTLDRLAAAFPGAQLIQEDR